MKVEMKKEKEEAKEIKFPVLMESTDNKCVVLFNGESEGMVLLLLKENEFEYVGHYSDNWIKCTNTNVWKPFTGTIELSNE